MCIILFVEINNQMDMSEFTNKQNEYDIVTKIDGGTYGNVFKAIHKPT